MNHLESIYRKQVALPTFCWVYPSGVGAIHHPDQPELPIVQQITCRRCRGVGRVHYARVPADIVGGKRIGCPECADLGRLDLAGQLFRHDITSHRKPLATRAKSSPRARGLP